ncbi:MAG: hypothetical protein AAGI63_15295 [Planctomycetota bacterium]
MAALLLLAGCIPMGGCRICGDCEDLAYPAYGGDWQRTRRYEGRVGSLFDPAGGKAGSLSERDSPPDPDELERKRQEGRANLFGPESYEPRSESDQPRPDDPPPSLDDLRQRQLDDIPNEKEDELRNRDLERIDINVNRAPNRNRPVTTALKNLFAF